MRTPKMGLLIIFEARLKSTKLPIFCALESIAAQEKEELS
jgi:hypothetical protein